MYTNQNGHPLPQNVHQSIKWPSTVPKRASKYRTTAIQFHKDVHQTPKGPSTSKSVHQSQDRPSTSKSVHQTDKGPSCSEKVHQSARLRSDHPPPRNVHKPQK